MSINVPPQIVERREYSENRLTTFREALVKRGARSIIGRSAFVYATGSIARGDASNHSDLDAFVVSDDDRSGNPLLSDLRTIELQASLIATAKEQALPEFSDDGKFLKRHSLSEMLTKLGTAEDDYENLFTARILLLLESRPILGDAKYDDAIEKILSEYWRDYAGHEGRFLPVYLTNDIIRYWKVLCLNYEANTRKGPDTKRRATNYKLKFSRLLTCYSALLISMRVAQRPEEYQPD
ncbi:MAG: nucleotidyltransferase domain-containing protein [Thermoanaerobaculia bacterium]